MKNQLKYDFLVLSLFKLTRVIKNRLSYYFNQHQHISPLVTFRVGFGIMMIVSIVRFWSKGWISKQYIEPNFYFTYYGFDWVKPLGEPGMYFLFSIMALAALGIALGAFYRYSASIFFLTFTYVELIDKTFYLNHYYFVSVIAFLLIFVPANKAYSLDAFLKPYIKSYSVPAWSIHIFILQISLVYFFAGLAKINSEWILEALPLKVWLPSRSYTPIIGSLLGSVWVAFVFSWIGLLFDLTIPLFLLWKRTRLVAYLTVILFHLMTSTLFQIGMFPFIMITSNIIFFSEDFHKRFWSQFSRNNEGKQIFSHRKTGVSSGLKYLLCIHLAVQLLLPFRYVLYPGKLFWTEQGYRFSWRVMLMEKAGYTKFLLAIPSKNKFFEVNLTDYLTPLQEKMMSTQPDMILQFAHFLRDQYITKHGVMPQVFVQSYATVNGKGSQLLIDPKINLSNIKRGYQNKTWILPYHN